ncbi:transmembrane amino acid transporter protein-domain-containing protein [Dunaliella salina]|uniref:Transmembrane amino acid transporter protein-domain-containing protein n=1 Tax=Dunaliella salina TaxID=3046 RepID=A0ABQ7GBU2_DUNSA|nr:transmembrane amino acid transporter protein-domain-containing protein [Dunaliella salina]|eukprot:KAF5832060.1 transmembrane amino acid transporter protein-domain-containing protein [Dunaliella salina]
MMRMRSLPSSSSEEVIDLGGSSSKGSKAANGSRGEGSSAGRISMRQSVFNLVNCILGAGLLGYPYCFKSSGIVLSTLIMLVCLMACRFSYLLLLYCTQLSSKRSYEDLTEQAVGRHGRTLVYICTAATNVGCIVAYLNIMADVLSSVAGTIIPPGAEPSRNAYLAGEACSIDACMCACACETTASSPPSQLLVWPSWRPLAY